MAIKKRNLDNSLVQWIQSQTGLPLGIGDIKYVAATAAWRQYLLDKGFGDVYSNPKTAYDACTENQNDVVVVFPGSYDTGEVWTYSKDYTHMIGVGPVGMTSYPVILYHALDSTEVDGQFKLTGDGCLFRNLCFKHTGTDTAAVTNVLISLASGCTFNHVQFLHSDDSVLSAGSGLKGLRIEGADNITFQDCVFGGLDRERTTNGVEVSLIEDSATSHAASNINFFDCAFMAKISDSVDSLHYFVQTVDSLDLTGLIKFERCAFITTNLNASNNQGYAMDFDSLSPALCLIKDPVLAGVRKFSLANDRVRVQGAPQVLVDSNAGTFTVQSLGLVTEPQE